jgi:hypothetical protein
MEQQTQAHQPAQAHSRPVRYTQWFRYKEGAYELLLLQLFFIFSMHRNRQRKDRLA